MDNAIVTANQQKSDKYIDLVDVLYCQFPNINVGFRTMVVGMMGIVPVSIKQTLRDIQPKAQTF